MNDDDCDRIWKEKVMFICPEGVGNSNKMDCTEIAESNKNAMRFDLCGDISNDLLFLHGQYILCSFTGRLKGCNTFGLCRSCPNQNF